MDGCVSFAIPCMEPASSPRHAPQAPHLACPSHIMQELLEGGTLHKLLNVNLKSTRQRAFSWYNQ